jgi:hypothetical protein
MCLLTSSPGPKELQGTRDGKQPGMPIGSAAQPWLLLYLLIVPQPNQARDQALNSLGEAQSLLSWRYEG